MKISTNIRIALIGAILIISAGYNSIATADEHLARSLALGYTILILILILLVDIWKRRDHRDDPR